MSHRNEKSSLIDAGGSINTNYTRMSDHSSSAVMNVQVESRGDPELPIPRAVFVVTNAALGAGMLAFPEAYGKTGGVPQALAVQAVSMVYLCFTLL